ncbi:pyrroline-5-carboxylate reductase [Enterococcus canis]|uniref:Pyrroline-5-carboxylate reductase n=1 Tax=Enterococcus canis TaxID=214095 RepID=A0A1L8RDQ8_9ENTE|nr:pyrroline-5-carboxylate reductase [Enterococcus canis]OJG17873.1 pyrroline-5-carboxylate reductase [Enterococcus canis]
MKIGFIGTGNMASAIIDGLLAKGPADIWISGSSFARSQEYAATRPVHAAASHEELAANCDIVILAVKPAIIPQVLGSLASAQALMVSIAAGVTLGQLKAAAPQFAYIRVMPNVNAVVGEGTAAICGDETVAPQQLATVTGIFESVGRVYPLAEKDFSTFIGIAGSAPAFVYMFIDALARAAVLHGLPKKTATEIAAHAVLGSGKMVLAGTDSPWDLVDKVSSPGGTTVAGVVSLERSGLVATVIDAVSATIAKDQEMQ